MGHSFQSVNFHDLILPLIAFASETLGTLSGFGSSTFFVPGAVFFESMSFVLALTAILHCFSNLSKLYLFKSKFNFKLLLKLALPSIVLTAFGALLNKYLETSFLIHALGWLLILMAGVNLLNKSVVHSISENTGSFFTAISGFLTGLLGTGGALRGFALMKMHLEKEVFVFMSAAIDFGGDLLRALIYLGNGYMDWSQWYYIPSLGLAAWLGTVAGKKILNRLHQKTFEKLVAFFILVSGVALVLK